MIARWGIRSRVMLVSVLPMLVLALLLTTYYTSSRIADLDDAFSARGRALARQVAAASEYAVFSGNLDALQQLSRATLAEDGVVGVTVFGRHGETLAFSGQLDPAIPLRTRSSEHPYASRHGATQRVVEPIQWMRLDLDDELTALTFTSEADPVGQTPLGSVVIDLSLAHLAAKRAEMLQRGALTALAVLLATLALALYMSRGVSRPIREVAATVDRIGEGRFSERAQLVGGGSLRSLAEGVNRMAAQLANAHDDMSRRIEDATAELRARKDEAERANLAKSRFLAAASHDLRQPMHALGLFIAELSRHELEPKSRHLLDQITAAARAMEDLLDNLLDISKLDGGALQPNVRPFALQPVLERIESSERRNAADRGLSLRVRPTDLWALSDLVLFERIVGNLVGNAVRYTRRGGILVACRRRGNHVRVEVRDSGIGIPTEYQAVVFQEFVQLDNPERARGKGLGLGLAIVRKLTDLLQHPLSLRSCPGKGSTFAIELPISAPTVGPPVDESARLPGDLAGIRVALLDDDPLALASATSLLLSWGCEVTASADLDTLLAKLEAAPQPPQVIVSDFRLGRSGDGIAAIGQIRARLGRDVPAALVTGDTAADALQLAQSAGLPVLHKPVRPARLRAFLNRSIADGE